MPRKKTARKKRGPSKKKKSARKTTARRRSPRGRGKSLGRGLVAVAVGVAAGWALVSWYGEYEETTGSAPPGLNVTARGDMLVEIPTCEQVAAMSHEERERVEGQVLAALAEVANND